MSAPKRKAKAQCNLGACYSKGRGVERSFGEANKWFSLAAAQEYDYAKSAMLTVARQMTPEQIADGVRLARGFRGSDHSLVNPR
jgi:TPR repeat protein